MTVKQLHEILGKYVDVGAGDWIVHFCQIGRFNTRKEYRDWLKSNPGPNPILSFEVGEVIIADVAEDNDGVITELNLKYVVLLPSLFIKDEKRAFYHLLSQDHVKGKKMGRTPKKLELGAKTGRGTKKGFKKSAKTTKGSKKK
jgi:hypothetical protein